MEHNAIKTHLCQLNRASTFVLLLPSQNEQTRNSYVLLVLSYRMVVLMRPRWSQAFHGKCNKLAAYCLHFQCKITSFAELTASCQPNLQSSQCFRAQSSFERPQLTAYFRQFSSRVKLSRDWCDVEGTLYGCRLQIKLNNNIQYFLNRVFATRGGPSLPYHAARCSETLACG